MTREWSWDDALYGGTTLAEEITGTWRHGSEHRRVFELDGNTWAVDFRMHPEHGVSDCNSEHPDVYAVRPSTRIVTLWVRS